MNDIEKRLTDIEARFAVSELRSKYSWYTVRAMRQEVLDLFTEDGVFQNHRNATGEPVTVAGRTMLSEYFTRMKPARRIPLVMNEVTHVSGDTAEGTCVMQSIGEDGFCGHYVDSFRKVDGRWLFGARRFFPYWPIFRPADRPHP